MASKMENWIAYQSRHLSPEEFAAWQASDVRVQSWLKKREGIPHAVQQLDGVMQGILKKVIGPALEKASEKLAQIEKQSAQSSQQTGLLAKSIGSTKAKLYPATFCGYVASGPRRGFARVLATKTKTGRFKKKRTLIGKKRGIEELALSEVSGSGGAILKNPLAYAQYLRSGRHAIFRPKTAAAFPIAAGGKTFFRRRVGAAAPRDFMAAAVAQSQAAGELATREINAGIAKLLPN